MSNEIPYGYCQCGCGRKTRIIPSNNATLGMVKGKPYKYVKGHHAKAQSASEAFHERVARSDDSDCWIWTGAFVNGYPQLSVQVEGKQVKLYAQRFAYSLNHGDAPADKYVRVRCGDVRCVNPDHTYIEDHFPDFASADPNHPTIPYGTCYCGCGEKTNLIPHNNRPQGLVKGRHRKYVKGHTGGHK